MSDIWQRFPDLIGVWDEYGIALFYDKNEIDAWRKEAQAQWDEANQKLEAISIFLEKHSKQYITDKLTPATINGIKKILEAS